MAHALARSGSRFTSFVARASLLPLLGIVWAAASSAQGGPPSPQAQVDAANPGDIVVLQGGSHGTLTITKPLTVIGAPAATFTQIVLNGSGGNLTLSNLHALSDLTGQGFDELRLSELDLHGAVSVLGLRYLEISKCSLGVMLANVNDIYAPGASVVLLDSTLVFGVGRVETDHFYVANSNPIQRLVALSGRPLANDLTITGSLRAGQSFVLSWSTPGPLAVIYAATGTRARPLGPKQWTGTWHLDLSYWPLFITSQSGSLIIGLPPSAHLYGVELAFQAVTPHYFSRPAVGIVR